MGAEPIMGAPMPEKQNNGQLFVYICKVMTRMRAQLVFQTAEQANMQTDT